MARIKISAPDNYIFSTEYRVNISDINYGNHLGNERILAIAHESRMRFFTELGIEDETKVTEELGIIMSDAAVVYKGESFYGDILNVELGVADINKYGFDLIYRVSRKKDNMKRRTPVWIMPVINPDIICFFL